jgi:hypothetical protein
MASDDMDTTLLIGAKIALLEMLDDERNLVSRATGFFVNDKDGVHLYTCWHVVRGIDFLNPFPKDATPYKRRRYMRVRMKKVTVKENITGLGNLTEFELDLFPNGDEPIWKEHNVYRTDCHDYQGIGISVPQLFDLVRIPVELCGAEVKYCAFDASDVCLKMVPAPSRAIIVGYPHGFSSMGWEPEPVFITRHIASNFTSQAFTQFLDGRGAAGMSGGPVLVKNPERFEVYGVYTGAIFPDSMHMETPRTDVLSALGLMTMLGLAQDALGAPGLFGVPEDRTSRPAPVGG